MLIKFTVKLLQDYLTLQTPIIHKSNTDSFIPNLLSLFTEWEET